jgi:hypothetical protein
MDMGLKYWIEYWLGQQKNAGVFVFTVEQVARFGAWQQQP